MRLTEIRYLLRITQPASGGSGPDPGLLAPDPTSFPPCPHVFKVTESRVMLWGAWISAQVVYEPRNLG